MAKHGKPDYSREFGICKVDVKSGTKEIVKRGFHDKSHALRKVWEIRLREKARNIIYKVVEMR